MITKKPACSDQSRGRFSSMSGRTHRSAARLKMTPSLPYIPQPSRSSGVLDFGGPRAGLSKCGEWGVRARPRRAYRAKPGLVFDPIKALNESRFCKCIGRA